MSQEYVQPVYGRDGFNCPHCGAYAHQTWFYSAYANLQSGGQTQIPNLATSMCERPSCRRFALWHERQLIHPLVLTAPPPNPDMPDHIKALFEEARAVSLFSPRAAAALLRVAVEQLTEHLGERTGRLNDRIGRLVQRGLPRSVQQSLDAVRVIGNDAVHATNAIQLNDQPDTAAALFRLVNLIVDRLIREEAEANSVYALLSENQRADIDRRDNRQDQKATE